VLSLFLLACPSAFTKVDDFCGTTIWGYEPVGPPDDAAQALARVNCYRSLMGLEPGVLDPRLDAAARSHALYMAQADDLTHAEDPGAPGFTGERVWDRVEVAGYALSDDEIVTELVAYGPDPTAAVDAWMNSVYHREALTMSNWSAMGFGSDGGWSSLAVVYRSPQGTVIYPADAQDGVPTRFDTDSESPDPLPELGFVGPPLSITGSEVEEASLTGPDGLIELAELHAGADPELDFMSAFVPVHALEPFTEYTFSVDLSDGRQLTSTFRTAP